MNTFVYDDGHRAETEETAWGIHVKLFSPKGKKLGAKTYKWEEHEALEEHWAAELLYCELGFNSKRETTK